MKNNTDMRDIDFALTASKTAIDELIFHRRHSAHQHAPMTFRAHLFGLCGIDVVRVYIRVHRLSDIPFR